MKRFLIGLAVTMTIFTLITLCAIGVWSVWYPWPPEHPNDIQNAVWATWGWCVVFPTVLVDVFVVCYGESKKWWYIFT